MTITKPMQTAKKRGATIPQPGPEKRTHSRIPFTTLIHLFSKERLSRKVECGHYALILGLSQLLLISTAIKPLASTAAQALALFPQSPYDTNPPDRSKAKARRAIVSSSGLQSQRCKRRLACTSKVTSHYKTLLALRRPVLYKRGTLSFTYERQGLQEAWAAGIGSPYGLPSHSQ